MTETTLDLDSFREMTGIASAQQAAEAHGQLAGLLTMLPAGDPKRIARTAREMADATGIPAGTVFEQCLDAIRRSLEGAEFEFEPVLPGDAAGLGERTECLGVWCGAFVGGIGASGAPLPETGEAAEAIRDLTRIARAGLDEETDAEEEEGAYAQVLEYVRVAVMLIHDTVRQQATQRGAAGQTEPGTQSGTGGP